MFPVFVLIFNLVSLWLEDKFSSNLTFKLNQIKINLTFNILGDPMGLSNQSHIGESQLNDASLFLVLPALLPLSLILAPWGILSNKVLAHKPFSQALLSSKARLRHMSFSVSLFWLLA